MRHPSNSVAAIISALSSTLLSCTAAELAITNQSFETPVLADGASVLSVPGWTSQGTVQIQNPNNSFFSGTSDGSSGSPIDGKNAVGINEGGKVTYQDTNWIIQPDVVYTLTFLAGHRISSPFGSSSANFWSGTNRLAQTLPTPVENTFVRYSLSYTSPAFGQPIGAPIRIELNAAGLSSQAWFDDFHLLASNTVCTPHAATATAQVINGFVVGASITDSGCGYTNAPSVVIAGGGGSGAAATAAVSNGIVVRITITSAGSGYTNAPTIVIGSPPFVPTISIRVSKVTVTQNVTLGRTYVLESSDDLIIWNPTGPPFTAQTETIETEFSVDVTSRYFRIREAAGP